MPSIDKMLAFAKSKHHKVKYSMAYPARLGPGHLDCSSFVYYSLIAGDFLPKYTAIGNTETLYKEKGKVLEEIYSYNEILPGDIFIRGIEGKSVGAGGHTGIFLRKGEIIHCNALNNTVTINNENSFIRYFLDCERSINERYFRPKSKSELNYISRTGKAIVHQATNVRTYPSTNAKIVAAYPKGSTIYYDRILAANGYWWLSYIGTQSGQRRYVAYKNNKYSWMTL